MNNVTISKERLIAIVSQAYESGFNKRGSNQIQIGSKHNGKIKNYFAITGNMNFESCPQVESKQIDVFDMTNTEGLGMALSVFDDLVDNLIDEEQTSDIFKTPMNDNLRKGIQHSLRKTKYLVKSSKDYRRG